MTIEELKKKHGLNGIRGLIVELFGLKCRVYVLGRGTATGANAFGISGEVNFGEQVELSDRTTVKFPRNEKYLREAHARLIDTVIAA